MNFFLILIFSLLSINAKADICDTWFAKTKIKKDSNCLNNCVVAKVDLSNFVCKNSCDYLCSTSISVKFVFSLSSLYPGLTDSERALVAKEPKNSLVVYQQKANAESNCSTLFGTNATNDESDACRYFLWASFLTHELGTDTAEKFLNAHEQEPTQPEKEKAMDLANNRAGILYAEKIIKLKIYSVEQVIKGFDEALSKNELIILNPKKRGN